MNIGEALAYGLLGGTAGAAEHYYEDWRDRTRRARDLAAQKEGWKYQTSEREAGQEYQSGEAEKSREFATSEREAGQLYQSSEAKKGRQFQREEGDTQRQFQAGQAEANVGRQLAIAQGTADIAEQYRDKGQRFAFAEDGKTLVPITPNADGSIPLPAAQVVGGNFSYTGIGADGKGLLKSGTGSKSSGSPSPKSIKSGIGMNLSEGSVVVDENGKEWQYVINPQTNLWERVPVATRETAPTISTPEQISEAEAFAEKEVNKRAEWLSSDATNFAPWGGDREAAKEYFTRNYLNGTAVDELGRVIVPGQPEVPITANQQNPRTPAESTVVAQPSQPAPQPENPIPLTKQHVIALNEGKIDKEAFKQIFGEKAFNRYYQPDITEPPSSPTATPQAGNQPPSQVGTILPGHTGSILGSWARPDYFSQREKQSQYEESVRQRKEQEMLATQKEMQEIQSAINTTIDAMRSPNTATREKMRLAQQLEVLNKKLKALQS